MKYLYHRNDGVFLMIKETNEFTQYPFIEISDSEENKVLSALGAGKIVKVIDSSLIIMENEINKRRDIVNDRKEWLSIITPYLLPEYQSIIDLNPEQKLELSNFYKALLDLPNVYDHSDDKQNFSYSISIDNNDKVDVSIVVPDFIK